MIDSFGVGSLNTRSQAKASPALSIEMLRTRRYDLVIFLTGANDVFTMDAVPAGLAELVRVQREALPSVPILMVGPTDRGLRRSFPLTIEVVEQRRRLAGELGLAYFSMFEAMGGRDAMSRFVKDGLAQRDAIHWNARGGDWAGDRLVHVLARGYAAHLEAYPLAGCREIVTDRSQNVLVRAPGPAPSLAAPMPRE